MQLVAAGRAGRAPPPVRAPAAAAGPRAAARRARWSSAGRAALLPVAVATVLGFAVLLGGLASRALPGDRLYDVKLGIGQAQVRMAGSDLARGKALLNQVDHRLDEVDALVAAGDPSSADVDAALNQAAVDLARAQRVLLAGSDGHADPESLQTLADATAQASGRLRALAPLRADRLRPGAAPPAGPAGRRQRGPAPAGAGLRQRRAPTSGGSSRRSPGRRPAPRPRARGAVRRADHAQPRRRPPASRPGVACRRSRRGTGRRRRQRVARGPARQPARGDGVRARRRHHRARGRGDHRARWRADA